MPSEWKVVVKTNVPGPHQIQIQVKEEKLGRKASRYHVKAQLYDADERRVVKSSKMKRSEPCTKQDYSIVLQRLEFTTSSSLAKTYTHAFTNARRQIRELS